MKRQHAVRDVVLLHGWGLGAGVWDELAARLARRFRVHAPDLPGYGAAKACTPYTVDALAAAIARTAPRACYAVGWSLGGQVALAWARRSPRQLERLALIATTPCFTVRAGWACAVAAPVLDGFARDLGDDAAATLKRFVALQSRGDGRAREVTTALRDRLAENSASSQALAGGLAILREADLRGMLRNVKQPTLVLQGTRDPLVPPAAARYLAGALPDACLELIPGCAHAPFVSRSARVSRALAEFFDA